MSTRPSRMVYRFAPCNSKAAAPPSKSEPGAPVLRGDRPSERDTPLRMSAANLRTVERAIGAVNTRDIDTYLACCTDDVELRTPVTPVEGAYMGAAGIRRSSPISRRRGRISGSRSSGPKRWVPIESWPLHAPAPADGGAASTWGPRRPRFTTSSTGKSAGLRSSLIESWRSAKRD